MNNIVGNSGFQNDRGLDVELLAHLATVETEAGLAELTSLGLSTLQSVSQLALTALDQAEVDPSVAKQLLMLASAVNRMLGEPATQRGEISYAQARLYLQEGNLTLAETALRAAQSAWSESNDLAALSRSRLGLTQLLTLQGRYVEAEQTCRDAITELEKLALDNVQFAIPLVIANNNLASQLIYQERHSEAVAAGDAAQAKIAELLVSHAADTALTSQLGYWAGAVFVNQATALMALDRPGDAERTLKSGIEVLQQSGGFSLGQAQSNLGSLFARTGRYGEALRQFDIASQLLLGEGASAQSADLARAELLLDQANTYLALNLLSEAGAALEHCEQLYRRSDQPYELAQSLLLHGLVRCRMGDLPGASNLLLEAERLFAGLQNQLWQNRTALALAMVEYEAQNASAAVHRLDSLFTQLDDKSANVRWDIATLCDARLLRLRLHLQQNEIDAAQAQADQCAAELQTVPLPQFELRLQHAFGQIAAARGEWDAARQALQKAVELLELQRSSLPIEEVRTAFLDDKSEIYADLLLVLLETPTSQSIEDAFAIVEQARSRALLERLLTLVAASDEQESESVQARRAELQQQLHWLYNRLLNDPGSRRVDGHINEEIRSRELALQSLEWQNAGQIFDAQPVNLRTLQTSLASDQTALIYFVAGDELMAFIVDRGRARLQRHICSNQELRQAQQEWRFQLGRAEMDAQYIQRHASRFEEAWRKALYRLYSLLIQPIESQLSHHHLLVIPYGPLHLLPFHALWDGSHFLIERYEISIAPSASLAVKMLRSTEKQRPHRSLAALAITDPAIPAAREEVEAAAGYFADSFLYIDEQATQRALYQAAGLADVLHLATHGLFRPDNAFFSALKLADGWVDVRQLYRLPLSARLVVLSACESGAGQVRGGDEVIGLARGFLGAGAQNIVASLWNVHDASSAKLMALFYQYLSHNVTPIAALRSAQLAAIQQAQHPYYWASYFVIG
ncbi:MAG: CHAT domain-containing protein [Caldilineaceae bacterium]